ncbi:hypothetical protein K469DRAFT_704138, partial [Zopfia rhizophila CBS 207.26]
MGKLSTLEIRVNPKATATGNNYTPIPKSLKCAATHYPNNVIEEDYTIKKLRIQARHDKKPFEIEVTLPTLMTLNQAIIASELERSHLKVLTHRDHADTLGKALNTAETELNEARDELTELRQLLNNTLKRVADQENEIKTLKVQIKKPTHNIYSFLSAKASLALSLTLVKKTRFTALPQIPQNQASYITIEPDNGSDIRDLKNIISYMRTHTESPTNQYLLILIHIIKE